MTSRFPGHDFGVDEELVSSTYTAKKLFGITIHARRVNRVISLVENSRKYRVDFFRSLKLGKGRRSFCCDLLTVSDAANVVGKGPTAAPPNTTLMEAGLLVSMMVLSLSGEFDQ